MAGSWYVDEGVAQLIGEWKKAHPGAVVGTIADGNHSTNPDVTQHAPDRGGSAPGDDRGEVDGADFMIGHGVTEHDLQLLFDGLVESRDPRILYVIHNRVIVSSVVEPWKRRKYSGSDPHTGHVHLSVNDKYDANRADWKWEARVERADKYVKVETSLPELLELGDEDAMFSGWNTIGRAQALANWLDNSTPDIDTDGVYGKQTAAKFGKALKSSGSLTRLTTAQLKQLHGLS
jgi:hypothetical protein